MTPSQTRFAVAVVTFNRPVSLRRVLESLRLADYGGATIDLIISVDFSGNEDCHDIATSFEWEFGNKVIVKQRTRLGLRNHIIAVGEHLHHYDAIAILEDDIYVSPAFFDFMKQSVVCYESDERIAGISLYSPHWSESRSRAFTPMVGKYDVYLMKYAQSWGQIWMKKQWFQFMEWYYQQNDMEFSSPALPSNISNWPATSWLKYHIKYCVDNDKYFVYPYNSYSTNFSDVGQHNDAISSRYQVPIVFGRKPTLNLPSPEHFNEVVHYDVFFEREKLGGCLGISDDQLCVNLYGTKPRCMTARYLLTTDIHPFKVVRSFGLLMRPHEMNVICRVPGDTVHLYDTFSGAESKQWVDVDIINWAYDIGTPDYPVIAKLLLRKFASKMNPAEFTASLLHWCSKAIASKTSKSHFYKGRS
jgi:hypothetical protein